MGMATPTEMLLMAVEKDQPDHGRILRIIGDGADLDAGRGQALRICAERNDYLTAKLLFLKGADIVYAIKCVQEEQNKIPMKRIHSHPISSIRIPQNEEDVPRYDLLSKTLSRLEEFKKSFRENTLPQEQARMLAEILENQKRFETRLDEFQRELETLTKPQKILKPLPKGLTNS